MTNEFFIEDRIQRDDEIIGLDLTNDMPDYSKPLEEMMKELEDIKP